MEPEFVDNRSGNTLVAGLRGHLGRLGQTCARPVELAMATGYLNPEAPKVGPRRAGSQTALVPAYSPYSPSLQSRAPPPYGRTVPRSHGLTGFQCVSTARASASSRNLSDSMIVAPSTKSFLK